MIAISLLLLPVAHPLDIPVDTWVARPVPPVGEGPSGEMKHKRLAFNPDDGRIYFLGGDYSGVDFYQSGRNEVFSYDVVTDEWRLEQAYCREDGGLQPTGPDQVGWAYDTSRNVFWMTPGYMTSSSRNNCPDPSNILSAIMSFDPVTKTWAEENRANSGGMLETKKFVHYDAVTDTLVRFATPSGPRVEIYDIDNDSWDTRGLGAHTDRAYLGAGYSAFDEVDRVIYMTSATEGMLMRYDVDDYTADYMSELPLDDVRQEGQYPIWDSNNRVLLWYAGGSSTPIAFFVYHPSENLWEPKPINQPEGLTVRGNAAVFDPEHNVMLIIGGYEPANPYLFLYRYADSSDDVAPAAPMSLQID